MRLPWGCSHPSFIGHARGLLTSLVTLLLLQLGSAQLRVVGPGQPVTGTVGQDVVLPCHLSPLRDARSLEVRWIRDDLSETVHHYRNGQDLYGEQMGAYAGRTELARDGLSAGSLDLRISGLRPSDDGQYFCTVKNADAYDEATVDLEVSATGADPHLSLGGYEDGGVRVLCRSAGWYPLPQLLWRDAHGQHLPSVSQTHSQDQEGLFEIEGAVIMTGSVEGPLSCVVRSSRLQQERESSLHISAPFFINAQPLIVALALVLVLFVVFIGLGVYLFRKQVTQRRELEKQAADLDEYRAKDERQSARLKDLTEELSQKDKTLAELKAELEKKNASLERQSGRLKDLNEELLRKDTEREDQIEDMLVQALQLFKQDEGTIQRFFNQGVPLTGMPCAAVGGGFAEETNVSLEEQATELENKDAKLKEQAAVQARRNFLLSHNRVKVTLDPDTAHPQVVVSQDKSSVRWESEWQQVPNALERFDTSSCVLGREEFREGRHCWEVEVEGEKGKY